MVSFNSLIFREGPLKDFMPDVTHPTPQTKNPQTSEQVSPLIVKQECLMADLLIIQWLRSLRRVQAV